MTRRPPLAAVVTVAALALPSHGPALDAPPGGDAVVNSLGMRMVRVPAGSFSMGSLPGTPLRQEEELPHRVTLTRAFRIASTEVTQRQWLALMPTEPQPAAGRRPPRHVRVLEGSAGVLPRAVAQGRGHLPPADRGGVGVRLPGGR